MKKILIIATGFFFVTMQAQHVQLADCYKGALVNYPNAKKLDLNGQVYEQNIKNIKTNYYPSLNLNGQAHYQSDVTKIPATPLPAFDVPEISNDWYKLNLDVEQMIYDGGITSGQKKVEMAKKEISDQKVRVEFYQVKERINHLFFNLVFTGKTIEILEVLKKNLEARIKEAEVAYESGIVLGSDVDALKVEFYKTGQEIAGKKEDEKALAASLNELTGLSVTGATDLEVPSIQIESYTFENNRPEYKLFSKQQQQLVATKSLVKSKRMPVLMAFGQAGYGRPGYDMLNDNFDDYYMIGARLHWNIWDWGKVKREKQVLDLQSEIIESQKETFNQNLRADIHKRIADINKYEKMIETDGLIVELQQNIVNTANNQFKNGTLTSTNYLVEVNKLLRSKLNFEAHKLQLIFAKFQYMTAIGNI